jgi:surface protein
MSSRTIRESVLREKAFPKPFSVSPNAKEWVRNPSWLPMPTVVDTEEKIVLLHRVDPDSNYVAFICTGDYTVNWGDGITDNWTSGATALHEYNFSNVSLAGTDAPVTFTESGNLVTRAAHGYENGMLVRFFGITGTTGIVNGQTYFVINKTADTFQVSATESGSALPLTTDGTGALLEYKQAIITITPQAGQNLLSADTNVRHTRANLQVYDQGHLDAIISVPNAVSGGTVTFGTSVPNVATRPGSLERCAVLSLGGITSTAFLFNSCYSLQSVPLFDTASVTDMSSMFSVCYSLQSVPLFNTASVTTTASMFNSCYSLQSVPLFNTSIVTDMSSMFNACLSLQSVPLFDTSSVTTMASMFNSCYSLQSVPLFNTSIVTIMSNMFSACYSLQSVPLFDTSSVTTMASMFNACSILQSVPLFNTASVTIMSSMFSSCFSLQSVPLFNTSIVTTMSNMFNACRILQSVPALDCGAVTSFGNFNSIFLNCNSLQNIDAYNFKWSFSVASCKLSGAALNKLYGNLFTKAGQTITVTGNHGTPDDTPSIATAKGWAVTGS